MALHLDRLTVLSMTERPLVGGTTLISELTRQVRVTGLPVDAASDYQVLQAALDELNSLVIGSSAAGHESLILVERRPQILPNHPDVVDITLRYELKGLTLDSIPVGSFIMEGSASLNQVTTQRDRAGTPLTVSYTYPADYELDKELRGKTVDQVGDVQVGLPQETIRLAGRLVVEHGDLGARERVGLVNDELWRDSEAGTWLVANADYTPYHMADVVGPDRVYEYRFWLQRNELGWDPDKWYRDPRSGRMPVGALIETVQWYAPTNFDILFPVVG